MASMKMSMSLRSSAVRPSVLSKRPAVVVRQGKGGEEGGKSFDKSCYGTLATNANYALLASALAKVIDISANQSKKIRHMMNRLVLHIFDFAGVAISGIESTM